MAVTLTQAYPQLQATVVDLPTVTNPANTLFTSVCT
jgi:hypothetical protein